LVAVRSYWVLLWCAAGSCVTTLLLGWLAPCARLLLPVHLQQGVLLAFNQLYRPLVVLRWLCAAIGCSCGALQTVVAPYCCCMGSIGRLLLISSETGLCW
jgi:hypothetical protein